MWHLNFKRININTVYLRISVFLICFFPIFHVFCFMPVFAMHSYFFHEHFRSLRVIGMVTTRAICAFLDYTVNTQIAVLQLAFRSCHGLRERKLSDVRRALGITIESNDETTTNLDKAVKQHLKDTAETFPMGDVERQVANQVFFFTTYNITFVAFLLCFHCTVPSRFAYLRMLHSFFHSTVTLIELRRFHWHSLSDTRNRWTKT